MVFEKQFTDETILEALEECLREATIPASAVAEKLGANPVYIKTLLLDMKERGLISGKMRGKTWGFRLK